MEYFQKYQRAGKAIHLVGVEFDKEKGNSNCCGNIGECVVETLPA